MISSANKINDSNNDDECSSESEKTCRCPSKNHHRTFRGDSNKSCLVIYIYMWITIFSICCSGLPPVIKIGTCVILSSHYYYSIHLLPSPLDSLFLFLTRFILHTANNHLVKSFYVPSYCCCYNSTTDELIYAKSNITTMNIKFTCKYPLPLQHSFSIFLPFSCKNIRLT
jgi:hypothetical protein